MGNLSQARFLLSASWKSWVKIGLLWVQLWLLALPTLSPRAGLENVPASDARVAPKLSPECQYHSPALTQHSPPGVQAALGSTPLL